MKSAISSKSAFSKDSHGNTIISTIPYGRKKRVSNGELYLDSTCPVDTSLTLFQSVFTTYPNIYQHAIAIAEANPTSQTNLLLQVFDLMNQKQWVDAKLLWVQSFALYAKLEPGRIN